jgi:hypothetical protein
MSMRRLLIALCLALTAVPSYAQKKNDQLAERSEQEILKTVKLPEGYEATVFAKPPMGGYPTSVSAAIDGTIFVAIDENGSLGRDRNPGWNATSGRVGAGASRTRSEIAFHRCASPARSSAARHRRRRTGG